MKVSKIKGAGAKYILVIAMASLSILGAQHMGQGNMGHNQNMDQNMMQHMGQQMMNMQQLMNNLDGMMDRTSGMMEMMHGMNQGHNNGSGNHMDHDTYDMGAGHDMGDYMDDGGNMGDGGMMNMVHSMDEMTKNMQGFMTQMNQMMTNESMMNDPLMNQYMENMQNHMETVMDGFDGVITQMEKIQILNAE